MRGLMMMLLLMLSVQPAWSDEASGPKDSKDSKDSKSKALSPVFSKTFVHQRARCKVDKTSFEVLLGNDLRKDGAEFKDFGYPYVWIRVKGRKPFLAMEAREGNSLLFMGRPKRWKKNIDCNKTITYRTADKSVVVLLEQDDRPGPPHLAAVVFDPAKAKAVASNRALGHYKKVEREPGGTAVELAPGATEPFQKKIEFKDVSYDVKEHAFSYWARLKISNGTVAAVVDPGLTWEKTRWKPYFRTREEFEKTFGWDETQGAYARPWVYSIDSNPPCVQAAAEHDPQESDESWLCVSPPAGG